MATRERRGWQQVFFVLGIAVLVLSGGCTTLFTVAFIADGGWTYAALPVAYGALPMVFGACMAYLARGQRREAADDEA